MKLLMAIAVYLAVLLFIAAPSHAYDNWPPRFDPLFGTPPSQNVKSWFRIVLLVPRASPIPTIYISTSKPRKSRFGDVAFDTRLSRSAYLRFASFTRSYRCEDPAPSRNFSPKDYLEIAEHADGQTRAICIFPDREGRDYIAAIMKLPEVDWAPDALQILSGFRYK